MAPLTPPAAPRNPLFVWQRRALWLALGVLAATGAAWLGVHYTVGAGAGELPHPLEAWLMKLHGAATFASLFVVGSVATLHVPRGWRLALQRASGGSMLAGWAGLAASGYALYYFAPESVRPWLGNGHAVLGFALAGLLGWHARRSLPGRLKPRRA